MCFDFSSPRHSLCTMFWDMLGLVLQEQVTQGHLKAASFKLHLSGGIFHLHHCLNHSFTGCSSATRTSDTRVSKGHFKVAFLQATAGLWHFSLHVPSGTRSYKSPFAGTSDSRVSESHLKAAVLHATSVSRQTHKRINTQACHSALQGSSHRAYQFQNTVGGRSRVSGLEEW